MSQVRAVLDANVLVSALINRHGPPGRIVERLLDARAFQIVVSEELLAELRRALHYPKIRRRLALSEGEISLWVEALGLIADVVRGELKLRVVPEDPDDDQYVSAAVEGLAQFLVTGDAHLLALKEYEGIRILTPREFLDVLGD